MHLLGRRSKIGVVNSSRILHGDSDPVVSRAASAKVAVLKIEGCMIFVLNYTTILQVKNFSTHQLQ